MIDAGLALRAPEVVRRIAKTFRCSAFATGLPDDFVECVFSIRFMHHIQKSEDRIRLLEEFGRISSRTVIVSLWVDGNFRAWRLRRKLAQRAQAGGSGAPRDRILLGQEEIERDIAAAGLETIGYTDFIKYWDKWRAYVLRVKK